MPSTNDALFARAQAIIPGGVNSPVRAFRSVGGTPRFIVRGAGPYVWDADGKRYVDYVGSWGPLILGHAHPAVSAAVHAAVDRGLSFGMPTEAEVEIAEVVCQLVPSMERVRFTSSGTEAAMTAIRLARGATGRSMIVKFEGCYHGHADALLVKAGSGLLTHGNPSSAGVPPEVTQHTLVLDYNDPQQLADAFRSHGDRIAAVMVEPVAGNMNLVPGRPAFLQAMRELCSRHGALLVFDEVMSGFRVALGGAQSLYGIRPDITVLGKVIGGGLPVAALGGRRDLMEHLSPLGAVYQAGTLSGNPVAVASGLATLAEIRKPGFFEAVEATTRDFVRRFNAAAADAGVPFCAASVGTMFGIYASARPPEDFTQVMQADKALFNRFFHLMLDAGVHFAPSAYEAGFMSSAHDAGAIDHTIDAAAAALRALRA
ncbi:MAG: glutamate-1-semialdehyde 2,1-aminomutase [Burkholderiales bacterium]|nr:glutamate-1-semialdehyde 2,1-aminomutase [Burkholderiales bacterium]